MKLSIGLLIALSMTAALTACGHKKINVDSETSQASAGPTAISATWIKEKMKKFDIEVTVANKSPTSQVMWLKDINCARGGVTGEVTMINARHGDVPIYIRPDTRQTFVFTCDLRAENVRGPYKFVVTRVFENPNGDGRTGGKIVAKDLIIEQQDK